MAIAGVEPFKINYLDDDVFIENAWDEPEAEIHSGFPETFVGYTETQVREILIKFAESVSVCEDIDYNWEEEPELVGFSLMMGGLAIDDDEGINEAVDEFMKMGD